MRLETNIPLPAWAELPALCRWARESLQAFKAKVPYQRHRNFALVQPIRRISNARSNARLPFIGISLDFPHKDTAVFYVRDSALPAIEEWLSTFPANFPNYSTLEDLLYGRNWNSTAQNHSGTAHGAGGGTGRATTLLTNAYHATLAQQNAAGPAGAGGIASHHQRIIQQLNALQNTMANSAAWDFATFLPEKKSFPKTERGEASLLEAISDALPEAEELEQAAQAHHKIHNKYLQLTGKSSSDTLWGTPPENSQLHIQQGEILATRIWFTDGLRLSSINQNRWWAPGGSMDGDVAKAGVFAFKREALAIPLLYCYIRNAHTLMESAKNAKSRIPSEFAHLRSIHAIVLGTVKLWGDVVEHQYGYRAQFARLATLEECSEPHMLPTIRAHYGVP